MSIVGYVFAGVFVWMLGQFCTQPDEAEPVPEIRAPALHELDMTQASGGGRHSDE